MLILATSKIQSNYQTTIPKEIRKNYDIDKTTVVEWAINDKGNPEINFRKKRNFKNLSGAFKTDEKTNALELKRSLYMRKVFLDTSFIIAYINSNDELYENALKLEEAENILSQDCYINNNVLNEVLTLTGRKINIEAAEEIYYGLIDNFEILNEYSIFNYTAKTFDIFKKNIGANSKKTKLSFTDSSIILTMKESNISDLISFNQQFKNFNEINWIGSDYL